MRDPSSCVGDAAGRACPPAAKEEAAKCFLLQINVFIPVTCCFMLKCFEEATKTTPDLSAALSCEFTENGGGTVRGQTRYLSLNRGVAGEPHTCQLHLPQIFLGIDQTTVCKY